MDNPIDFITQKITEGITNAVDALEEKNLMIASATLHLELNVNIPGLPILDQENIPLIEAKNTLTIIVGPNPYRVNQT
jgi:hypothetical protein